MEKKRHTTASGEDYLEAVLILDRQKGDVRCVDLATFLERSKPTVTNMVTRLCESGFLVREDNKSISLTTKGKEVAEKIVSEIGFTGELRWDSTKPDGTLRKLTDVSKLHSLGWHHKVEIDEGIHRLYEWYLQGICINHQMP